MKPLARKGESSPGGGTVRRSEVAAGSGSERAVRCLGCGHRLTGADAATSAAGAHTHTFMNPGGFVFEIACYRDAPGTVANGLPSGEWSWFPGHLWQIALCAACKRHVGWSFHADTATFFGLIRDRIADSGD